MSERRRRSKANGIFLSHAGPTTIGVIVQAVIDHCAVKGITKYRLCKDSGIVPTSIKRFLDPERVNLESDDETPGVYLATALKILQAAGLDLEVVMKLPREAAEPAKRVRRKAC